MKALKLEGKRFGWLAVIKKIENNKWGHTQWLCECECGNIIKTIGKELKSGHTKSCGCLQREITSIRALKHGYSKPGMVTKTYKIWLNMRQRCNNPNNHAYKYYGARRISVCERWNDFENFLADMGEIPDKLTLDRKNNDGNYEPDNCKWATRLEQGRNNRQCKLNPLKVQVIKKLLKESRLTQPEIAEIFHVVRSTISSINISKTWNDIQI